MAQRSKAAPSSSSGRPGCQHASQDPLYKTAQSLVVVLTGSTTNSEVSCILTEDTPLDDLLDQVKTMCVVGLKHHEREEAF